MDSFGRSIACTSTSLCVIYIFSAASRLVVGFVPAPKKEEYLNPIVQFVLLILSIARIDSCVWRTRCVMCCKDKDARGVIKIATCPRSDGRDLSLSQIKKKYFGLAKKYHPDQNKDNPDAKHKFQEVTEVSASCPPPPPPRAAAAHLTYGNPLFGLLGLALVLDPPRLYDGAGYWLSCLVFRA